MVWNKLIKHDCLTHLARLAHSPMRIKEGVDVIMSKLFNRYSGFTGASLG